MWYLSLYYQFIFTYDLQYYMKMRDDEINLINSMALALIIIY